MALFPIPLITNLPLLFKMAVTAFSKEASMYLFNSTGTPALYLHAAEAIHGDSGMIQNNDIVLIISKSGESPEIKNLVQLVKQFGNTIIGMVGNKQSYLATQADLMIDTTVTKEACINNLAPTSSTTAQMVMGDVIAVCLMELKQFSVAQFAQFHPGGNLGKKLTLTTQNLADRNLSLQKVAIIN